MSLLKLLKRWWLERQYPTEKLVQKVIDLSTTDLPLSFAIEVKPYEQQIFRDCRENLDYRVVVNGILVFSFYTAQYYGYVSTSCLHRGDWCKELSRAHKMIADAEMKAYQDKFIPLDELKEQKRESKASTMKKTCMYCDNEVRDGFHFCDACFDKIVEVAKEDSATFRDMMYGKWVPAEGETADDQPTSD